MAIAIEDLHWIDKTSEEFIDYFIGWMTNAKILLILLYRPEYIHQWGNKSYFNRIGVNQLTRQSSTELVKAILEGGYTSTELDDLILNRAAGNPFFMEELTHSLLENGTIQKEKDTYILTRPSSDIQVPQTVQGVIAARIDRLEENLKKIMQVAAVIGREFAFRILQAIIGMREELKARLLNLQGLEFIYEKSLFPELEYIFKHALIQEVAYNSLLVKPRKEIHEKIGSAIEQIYAERLEEFYEILGHHYLMAGNSKKAFLYSKLAGDKAAKACANHEAFRFYKQAQEIDDEDILAPAAIGLILSYFIPGKFTEIVDCALKTMRLLEKVDKKSGFFGYSTNIYLQLQSYCGLSLALLGKIDEGEALFEKALGFARDLNHLGSLGLTEWYCGCLFNVKGDGETASDTSKIPSSALRKGKFTYFYHPPGINGGWRIFLQARWKMPATMPKREWRCRRKWERSIISP